jgi:hypothetical protein
MKNTAFAVLCLSVLIPFAILAADTNAPPRLTVELRDGSRVVGASVEEKMKFHSALLGDVKLAVKDIRSVECVSSNAAKLTTAGGDSLTVAFVDAEFAVKTSFGKVEMPVASVRKFTVFAGGANGGRRAGLVALWSAEGNANDSVGGNHGQLMGNVRFAPGKIGQGFALNEAARYDNGFSGFSNFRYPPDRGNGFVLIPANPALNVGAGDGFTLAAWIKPATVSREMLIAEYEKVLGTFDGADVGIDFAIQQGTGSLHVNILDVTRAAHELLSPPNVLTPGVWQQVALTYDKASGAAALYLNGAAVAQANFGSIVPQTSFPYLVLGARTTFGSVPNPRSAFAGGLDEVAIYNRALSDSEVRENYEADNKATTLAEEPVRQP